MDEGRLLTRTGRTLTRFGEPASFPEGLYRVGRDAFAWMVPNGSWGETNLGLVRFGQTSLLVDTCWSLPHMSEMLTTIADLVTEAPIELVINTHADGDHCWGNQMFPGREIVASHSSIAQMHHLRPRTLRLTKRLAPWMCRLPSCGLSRFGHYMEEMLQPYDFRGITIVPPTRGFSNREVIDIDGEVIVLTEVGPGHTNGDVVVEVPSRRVAYCGDVLFVGVTPVMWAGPIEGMLHGLAFVRDLDVDVRVPGHGPLASMADVQALIDYWTYIQEQLDPHFRGGMTATTAAHRVLVSADYARHPWARWALPERLVTNAITLYRHWGASAGLLERSGPAGVMWQQAGIDAKLRART